MRRIGLLSLAVAGLAVAVAASPSAAHALSVRVGGQLIGPRVAGALVVWGEQDGGALRVHAANAAGVQQELGAVRALPGRNAFDLAIGGGGVTVSRVSWPSSSLPVAPDRYRVAVVGGVPWIDCAAPESFLSIARPRLAGDGATVVSPGAGCRGDAVLVRTPGAPDRTVVEPGPVVDLRVDGDWLAATVDVGGAGWLIVHDLRTQAEAYRLALSAPSFAFGSTPPYALDIDRDGTAILGEPTPVVLASGAIAPGSDCTLWWTSPAEPSRHELPFADCASVRLRDGVLLVTRRDGPVTALVATTLAATGTRTIRRAPRIGDIDFSGDAAAWSEQNCLEATYVRTGDLRAQTRGRPSGCVIRVLGRGPLSMDARGGVRLMVQCPDGCNGAVNALRCGHQRCISKPVSVRLAAGRRTAVRLALTPRTRRLVRGGAITATLKSFATLGPTRVVERRIVARRP